MTEPEPANAESSAAAVPPTDASRPAQPYQHDPALVPVLAQLADAAAQDVGDPHDAGWRVQLLAERNDPPMDRSVVNALVNAFLYTQHGEEIPQAGAALAPMDGPALLPIAMHDASNDVRKAWLALDDEVTHPVARARFYDIVFTLRLGRVSISLTSRGR